MKPDEAHIETDRKIAELEKRMRREYRQAAKEVEAKLEDYFRRFEKKDAIKRAQLEAGEISKADYDGWRTGQMLAGERWKEMRDTLAAELNAVNANARRIVNGERAEVYAENHNYATYEIEKAAKVDTSYTLYDRSTVERIVAKQPDILPAPGKQMKGKLARGEAVRWQAGQIQSVTLQSILQGESIPNMAKRIGRTLGEKNYGTAVRYARTAMTGAQSAGRQDSYKRAEDMGINLKRRWVATLDMRTRHEHRMLDMQVRGVDEPFDAEGAEIMFPGDPNAPAHLIWNCRCRTIAEVEGLEHNWDRRSTDALEGMTYEEWKQAHGKSQPITAQTEKGEAAKRAAIAEYRNAGKNYDSARRIYGTADGMNYKAYDSDDAQIETTWSATIEQPDGTRRMEFGVEETITPPNNENKEMPMVFELPSAKGFKDGVYHSDRTQSVILTNGRIAVDRDTANNNTRLRIKSMLENEIDILGGIREDGVFYRVTDNKKDSEYIKTGKIRPSKNHMTGEKEEGLSVWETPKYFGSYLEKIKGDVIGIGSDGEPLLDVKTIELVSVNDDDIAKMREAGKKRFCEKYGWTEEQLNKALAGNYKKRRI